MRKNLWLLVFCIFLSSCDSSPSQEDIENKANAGDSAAQIELYKMYSSGRANGGKNDSEAIKWLKMAAESGNPDAQYTLGTAYSNGWEGLTKNSKLSAQWLELAVKGGNKSALFLTAMNYMYGWGVEEDHVKAYAYLLVAQSFRNKAAISEETKFRYSLNKVQRVEAEELASDFKERYFK